MKNALKHIMNRNIMDMIIGNSVTSWVRWNSYGLKEIMNVLTLFCVALWSFYYRTWKQSCVFRPEGQDVHFQMHKAPLRVMTIGLNQYVLHRSQSQSHSTRQDHLTRFLGCFLFFISTFPWFFLSCFSLLILLKVCFVHLLQKMTLSCNL